MRYDLYGFAEIISCSFLVDDGLIDPPGGHIVILRRWFSEKTLVMAEIQVGFGPIIRDLALSVLIWIEGAWIDIDIWIELLNGDG